ncbi:MAG: T9SS type A sorting domain-containing protein, partial [Prevotellaceae bacterium]|nr:T9SS type A sorting domain-containing protein [Prevotellaceae bacterium]
MRRILITGMLLFTCSALWAQEVITGLYVNGQARPQPASGQAGLLRLHSQGAALQASSLPELPFVDDFAEGDPFPRPDLWESKGVFVNTTYGIEAPTVGVATFDAQDDRGHIYKHIGQSPAGADTLASRIVNLQGKANAVLSFFYQPGGAGDVPEGGDSLKLEFFSTGGWKSIWAAAASEREDSVIENYLLSGDSVSYKGDAIHTKFRYVAIAVDEPDFLHNGFRFRFVNLASMAASPVPGRESNCDHWHIDFVYLNSNRSVTDSLLPDVAICEPQRSPARVYSSVPARHLNSVDAQRQLFGDMTRFTLTYRNFGWATSNITRRFAITPLFGSNSYPEEYSGGSENIFIGQKFVRNDFEYDLYDFSASGDSAAFEIKSYLITDNLSDPLRSSLRYNDTVRHVQGFYNYYSYDDGVAENGYGLFGTGTANGQVAVRFTPYLTDSLRAVNLYFNLARDSANAKSFRIVVWADNNGMPGEILSGSKVSSPVFSDGLNRFVTYKLPEAIEIKRGQPFYAGWIQLSETFLNVGYDVNSVPAGVNFYNINNTWYPSLYAGALMIRPVFGKASEIPGDAVQLVPDAVPPAPDNIIVFPNPAADVVNIRYEAKDGNTVIPAACRIDLFDMGGRFVRTVTAAGGNFSVQGLENGLYVLRVYENNRFRAAQKILV